ncbi:orotate phosphoribosyltransferase [Oscillospiraceae bacterium OttesenSCG-928-F05]|nr:orotate phosphoribosyltransferase [Oscillospiraceae bacterium OttesenSCG-928-F05]
MSYKTDFIELMCRSGVLIFGDFTTKSGRKTPYFINTGNYRTGLQLRFLGEYYAGCIYDRVEDDFDLLFGPAYKGIPLVTAAAMSLAGLYKRDVRYAFNRKEQKDHGEGGGLVGAVPKDGDRVVIVEDVVTAGTAVRETVELLKGVADVSYKALIVSVDRCERGTGEVSAFKELEQTLGLRVCPIVTVYEIIEHLHNRELGGKVYIDDAMREKMEAYLKEYGAADGR